MKIVGYVMLGVGLVALALWFYFAVAGGTLACIFAEDPYLCSAVDRK